MAAKSGETTSEDETPSMIIAEDEKQDTQTHQNSSEKNIPSIEQDPMMIEMSHIHGENVPIPAMVGDGAVTSSTRPRRVSRYKQYHTNPTTITPGESS